MSILERHSRITFLFFVMVFCLVRCTSPDVIVEVVPESTSIPAPTATPAAPDSAQSVDPAATSVPAPAVGASVELSPAFQKLHALLKSKGYEGIGLEFEDDATLEILFQVFSDPKTSHRKLKTIYTGATNSYDARGASVTLAKSTNARDILAFITRSIPSTKSKKAATPKTKQPKRR